MSQLDGEGVRQMQLQQEQAIKETFKEHVLKQASDVTGVNTYDLRQSSNAETNTNIINNMFRPTSFRDVVVQQGTKPSRPAKFTDEYFNNDVNGIPTSDVGIDNFHQGTQVFNISDDIDTNAPADTDIDEQVARVKSLADYELRQTEIRNKQIIEGVRQEAVSALPQQEQEFTQQRAQDHAQATAQIQQT